MANASTSARCASGRPPDIPDAPGMGRGVQLVRFAGHGQRCSVRPLCPAGGMGRGVRPWLRPAKSMMMYIMDFLGCRIGLNPCPCLRLRFGYRLGSCRGSCGGPYRPRTGPAGTQREPESLPCLLPVHAVSPLPLAGALCMKRPYTFRCAQDERPKMKGSRPFILS